MILPFVFFDYEILPFFRLPFFSRKGKKKEEVEGEGGQCVLTAKRIICILHLGSPISDINLRSTPTPIPRCTVQSSKHLLVCISRPFPSTRSTRGVWMRPLPSPSLCLSLHPPLSHDKCNLKSPPAECPRRQKPLSAFPFRVISRSN